MIGDGRDINFWCLRWLDKPVVDLLNIPPDIHSSLNASVFDFIKEGLGIFPLLLQAGLLA